LRPIAQKEGVDAMITGSVTKVGNELEFFIILYERSMIIRMKRFRIEDSPLALVVDVGGYIQEVVTGQAPAVEEDPMNDVPLSNALDEEGDIFGGDEDPLDFSLDPEEEARKEAAARAEEERLAEEARQAEEARRKQEMEEQARRLAMEAEAARLAAEANQAAEDDFDFDFAPSTVEVVDNNSPSDGIVEEDDLTLNFDEPKPKKEKAAPKKEPKKEEYKPSTSYNSSRTKKSKSSKSVSSGRIDAAATMTGKVGAGNFQTLNFVTYGGEVGVHMSEAVSVQIAADGFVTY
jgi:pyruvate/2-oxoglutarate dehydrogenase complex dihydrolipoamide acyltransferase (E2) component